MSQIPKAKFSLADAQRAANEWGANCGPGAVAAVTGMTLDQVRPHLGDFESKHYTNPRLMFTALKSLGVKWAKTDRLWPHRGLVRVQWEGPWTLPGVPLWKRQRHTHWVASCQQDGPVYIFDINCICIGGWVSVGEWVIDVVPWLLRQVEPLANGKWSVTHKLEVAVKSV